MKGLQWAMRQKHVRLWGAAVVVLGLMAGDVLLAFLFKDILSFREADLTAFAKATPEIASRLRAEHFFLGGIRRGSANLGVWGYREWDLGIRARSTVPITMRDGSQPPPIVNSTEVGGLRLEVSRWGPYIHIDSAELLWGAERVDLRAPAKAWFLKGKRP